MIRAIIYKYIISSTTEYILDFKQGPEKLSTKIS